MQTSRADISYWLAANRLPGIGPVRLQRWLEHFKELKNLFAAEDSELQELGLPPREIAALKNPDWHAVEKDLVWREKKHAHIVSCVDERYPQLLREAPGAPILLYVLGNPALLQEPQVAIVGSRNPTVTGVALAEDFASYLTAAGLVITSGLALGIDAASHRGALATTGKTIAVMGSGLQYVYPPEHHRLAEEIVQAGGALVSEFPLEIPAKPKHFPMRNRIISGLSLGVLVVEAALRSGSLITAQFALEQGREVFALPGSIHNPLARGCHQLIREGAKLVETAQDITEELGFLNAVVTQNKPELVKLEAEQANLLTQIGYETTPLDAIIVRCGLTAGKVSSMLLALELEGYVTMVPGGYVRNL